MSQNLSFSSIAATLAVLSASATGFVACAANPATPAAESPSDAKEVPAATTTGALAAASEAAPPKDENKPTDGASAAPAPEAPRDAAPTATPPAASAPAATPPAATAPAAAAKTEKPKAAAPKKKPADAKMSCGHGTCDDRY